MDCHLHVILRFSLCFIALFPHFSHSSLRSSLWNGNNEMKTWILKLTTNSLSSSIDPTPVTQISWHPRAFIYRNFLTNEECDHFISPAKDGLKKSMVNDYESGESIESEIRTSSGAFLHKAQDEVVANVEARIAAWTFLPQENGEQIQIQHYEHGQKYEPHFDSVKDKVNQEIGGHRVATVLMYLSDVDKGVAKQFFRDPRLQNLSQRVMTGLIVLKVAMQ